MDFESLLAFNIWNDTIPGTAFTLPGLVVRLGMAILILIVGFAIIRWILGAIAKRMRNRQQADPGVIRYMKSVLGIVLKVVLIVSVASFIGIETASFIAVIAAAGLAIGLALQGTLANFAGGFLIMVLKPFREGEYIEAQGQGGVVNSIQIFNTILHTIDGNEIIIPNGKLSNEILKNVSSLPTRRTNLTIGIGYADDISEAKRVINSIIATDDRILKEPEPSVVVVGLGESSVDIAVRVWAKNSDYWGMLADLQQNIKEALDKAGIEIPFPQRSLHVIDERAAD